ncbi:MAG: TrpB-like pyridoxal phosphate-dependent enzyme [Candidatus Odinarchaeota archaeon]|nr:TrpB-like pyridoxal phosphate-dependent enzyme [Candidatus Odinarchaeota archaeon]
MKILLDIDEIPKYWYNILADLPKVLPPLLNPQTKTPVNPDDLKRIFIEECVKQEVSTERYIKIPEEIREVYIKAGRPTPLQRATKLEEILGTPAKIFFKREDVSPTGSHKTNTAIAQAYYAHKEGVERLTTETGAGQWGSALAYSAAMFNLKVTIYMTRSSYLQKPYRKILMELFGAEIFPSPSNKTSIGKKFLKEDPNHPGSLGIAISEALEDCLTHKNTKYSLGSVLNHVLFHQTVIGLETKKQFEKIDEYPDIVIGCVGGGSNFAGISYPFLHDKIKKNTETEFIAVEPTAVPSLTKGVYAYDYGDTGEITPLLKMFTIGHTYKPPPIHAGGLRYHGAAPSLSLLVKEGLVKVRAYGQLEVFEAAKLFAKAEGLVPAPETAHAVKAAIDEAIKAKKEQKEKVILFNFSGHGFFDLQAYQEYLEGKLTNYNLVEDKIMESMKTVIFDL